MNDAAPTAATLTDDLRAAVAGLAHARRALGDGDFEEVGELWGCLDRCARRLSALDDAERLQVQPTMLALLDELERTMAAFDAERRDLAERFRSARRSMMAGAAYRQAKAR